MIMMRMRMTKKRVFGASRCLQNLGPDKKVYDRGDDDDSDDDDGGGDYVDGDDDDQDDEEDGV